MSNKNNNHRPRFQKSLCKLHISNKPNNLNCLINLNNLN